MDTVDEKMGFIEVACDDAVLVIEDDSNDMQPAALVQEKKIQGSTEVSKTRKRRGLFDENAPRQPLNGYVRFYNSQRSVIKEKNPDAPFMEITKLLAHEWQTMPAAEKQVFLDEAEKERKEYQEEMLIYKKTASYKDFQKVRSADAAKKAKMSQESKKPFKEDKKSSGTDIPIFTEDFLQHNRLREAEIRDLRKQTVEFEEENANLASHVENLKGTVAKLEVESVQQRNFHLSLTSHLDKLRSALVKSLSGVKKTGSTEQLSTANVDAFLCTLVEDHSEESTDLLVSVKAIVNKMNLKSFEKD